MLQTLKIENFAIIKEASIDFEEGFTVLSGETGAGKSIVIDAISLLLGARSSEDDIRTGEEECNIEGLFLIRDDTRDFLNKAGLKSNGDELLIKRTIVRKGKNRIYINGSLSTSSILYDLGKYLVDICAQNENRYLMNPAYHIEVLDGYAADDDLLERYTEMFQRYSDCFSQREDLISRHREIQQKADFLRFVVKEIRQINLKEGEAEQLRGLKKRLQNSEKVRDLACGSYERLASSDDALIDKLKQLEKELDSLRKIDESFGKTLDSLPDIRERLVEVSSELSDYISSLDFDKRKLDEVEERLDAIVRIERKYGSVEAALLKAEDGQKELESLENYDDEIAAFDERLLSLGKSLASAAKDLSLKRKKKAKKLDEAINLHLKQLSMENARFQTVFSPVSLSKKKDSFNIDGVVCSCAGSDEVEFYISANVGENPKPLEHVASMGELSRIMLALKGVFYSEKAFVDTFVFDEIDTGIGGKVAEMVGSKLCALSSGKQVLCVTHLSQIASFADHHLHIEKMIRDKRTHFTIKKLNESQRKDEIARMIGGLEVTQKTKELADEIITRSKKRINT